MPHPSDMNLLLQAKGLGLLSEVEFGECLRELQSAERAGKQLRLAQLLLKKRLVQSGAIIALLKKQQAPDDGGGSHDLLEDIAAAAQVRAAVAPGARVGSYTLLREVARGGMGILFEATRKDGARIALKVLSARASTSEVVVQRFRQEARLAQLLDHPCIVKVHEVGVDHGIHYLAMDFFEGRSLADLLKEGRLAPRKAIEIVATISDAVDFMHAKGVLHRDIKPGNIMVGRGGAVCLTDFGLAKDLARTDVTLTQAGIALGTPAYMAPEQARGDLAAIGPWTDVYGLGAVLFRSLAGRYPVEADSFATAVRRIAAEPPPRLWVHRPDAPDALDALLLRAMATDTRDRPAPRAFAQELRELLPSVMMPPAPPNDAV